MKKWMLLAALALLAWQYMDTPSWQNPFSRSKPAPMSIAEDADEAANAPSGSSTLDARCDGRRYCSQMTSCAEAKAFLRSCPGMKMDGDGDGIPCEEQWCRM
ncbi:Excalibur calcium-binding domain-containing protein [Pseudomonas delhiensis]|uniref:Excalibur calcium-binding domain-containing protein n=1 Tax=Pseudomonas delhiensis TaxID=366289 RepID=A0A239F8U2_9PSED|nr:excalibur calcium-binding domain-containing protein [Pseudomonas delhiensis]SDI12831.1 Excalibur calcium-binding domain-containing protein [Pseudomonas delhiensis]SNS52743.1 Excalibur calcium-binding domain-containing protein [Pseudomonas delhiensis]